MSRLFLSCFLALLLAACGGGGGGGSGTSTVPTSTPTSTGLTLGFSTSSLSFDYVEGGTPASKTMTATATGTTDKDLLMGAEVTGLGIALPIGVAIDPVTRVAQITITPARGLAAGTYTGTIKLLACTTQDCTVQHAGSPHIVNYTVTVQPALKLVQTSLSVALLEAGIPFTTRLDFAAPLPVPQSEVGITVTYGNGTADWLRVNLYSDHADLHVLSAGLAPGTYTATLAFSLLTGQVTSIPISLKVGSTAP
jgi:hypothetical protein